MGAINFDDVYANAYIRESVGITTERLIRRIPSLASFRDDIRQELWIYIAQAVDQYDSERGVSVATFFRNVMEKRIVDIRRRFFAANSNEMLHCSMDAEDGYSAFAKDEIRLTELRMDLTAVMKRLSPTQRQICRWIMDGASMRGIARRMKIPYSSLFHFYVNGIRDEFEKEKMQKYLENL